jgi:outer membrane protein TolC
MKVPSIRRGLWLLAFVLPIMQGAEAQQKFTLDECINYAFEHNPLLAVTAKDVSIAGIATQRATGLYLPRASFVSAFQYYIAKRRLLIEGGTPLAPSTLPEGEPLAVNTGYTLAWYSSFNINQLIFDPGYRSNYNIALQNRQLQEQQLAGIKIDLLTGIHKAFEACKLLELQIRFLNANITRIDTLISLTRTKFEKGASVKIEVNRVEVTGNRMKSELANIRNNYSQSLLALQFQMNYLERDSMVLVGDFAIPEVLRQTDTLMNHLLQGTPSVRIESRMLQTQISIADESIKLERARAKPSVGADGSLGFTPAANDPGKTFQGERWKPFAYVGLNLTIPLFNGLDVKRAVEQKKLQASQSRNYMDQFILQFENEKRTVYVQIRNALERYSYAAENFRLANDNIKLLQEAFINGVADNQDLILGENDLYENQARYYAELLDLTINGIEGLKAIGLFNSKAGL